MPRKIVDITRKTPDPEDRQPPEKEFEGAQEYYRVPIHRPTNDTEPSRGLRITGLVFIAIVLIVGIYGLRLVRFRSTALLSARTAEEQFNAASGFLKNLDIIRAREAFGRAAVEVDTLYDDIQGEQFFSFSLKSIPEIVRELKNFSDTAVLLGGTLDVLGRDGLDLFLNNRGEELISLLRTLQRDLFTITKVTDNLKSKIGTIGYAIPDQVRGEEARLFQLDQFLNAALRWLESPETKHVLVFFQNPSEIRPGGGFIGSYASVEINRGGLADIDVRDIYDPDGQLDLRIVPPKPLQGLTKTWGARDANWFFDFPTSARKVTEFLEASKFYKERSVTFDGVLSLNTFALQGIIDVTGPIEIPEYDVTITAENALDVIQAEVRAGDDRDRGDPKRIIKILTPILIDRLQSLSADKKKLLLQALGNSFKTRDIFVYFEDLALEAYLQTLGVTGDVINLPDDFAGDYLAVVNANVAGGKTDVVIDQSIRLTSIVDESGTITNTLAVDRTHRGDKRNEWWYQIANQNYIQILTPPGSTLIEMGGNDTKAISPAVNYARLGYEIDQDLFALETSDIIFGKSAFRTWLITEPGETDRLSVRYVLPEQLVLDHGGEYTFIFEKQSGVNSRLHYTIQAPAGYFFEESGSRTFSYETAAPAGRIMLRVTLLEDRSRR